MNLKQLIFTWKGRHLVLALFASIFNCVMIYPYEYKSLHEKYETYFFHTLAYKFISKLLYTDLHTQFK